MDRAPVCDPGHGQCGYVLESSLIVQGGTELAAGLGQEREPLLGTLRLSAEPLLAAVQPGAAERRGGEVAEGSGDLHLALVAVVAAPVVKGDRTGGLVRKEE